ncbi:patatin-like phospholipase family protein [Ihubacter sp. mB4P-1]|uniref:patatin-like phospholipase family protein n=1 Tax=Ihubacter sp. mB4P-1 TaxID=3242370 RepID=UPI003C7CEF9A
MKKSPVSPKKKTALVLSGGGSRGAYQCGVWQALTELGVQIDIVIGVSVGAINGAMVMQGDPIKTANLWREMETDMVFDIDAKAQLQDYVKEFLLNRGAGTSGLQSLLREYVNEEDIRRSPVDFGLVTVEIPSMRPHYLWKEDIPRGQLYDYITASASAFPAVHPIEIDGRYFIDGGYADNLPVAMALEKGVTEVIAVYLDAVGRFRPEELKQVPNLTFIESKWDLGDFLTFDKANARRILRIGYLDAMKTFGVFDGAYYTFIKGAFTGRLLRQADHAAKIFELDPLILYSQKNFTEALKTAVDAARKETSATFTRDTLNIAKLKEIIKSANKKTAVIFIAETLRENDNINHLLSKYALRLFREEIDAAKMLINLGIAD